jgi:DNA-binding transcriptional ArsR family regulator
MGVTNEQPESDHATGDEQIDPSGDATTPSDAQNQQVDQQTETETGGEPETETLSPDVIFEVLKNERRRLALRYLRGRESKVSLGKLAEHIAAIENDKDVSMVRSNERKRVYVGLYQCHLPKMDDMGIVEFNRGRGLIELTDQAEQLFEYLDTDDEPETQRWYRYYGAASMGALLASALVWTGVIPAPGLVMFAVVAVFGCCTVAHLVATARHEDEDD